MASILLTGKYLPPQRVTNDNLSKVMDTSDEWIVQRSGIKERRWIREGSREFIGMANHEMAYEALLEATDGNLDLVRSCDAIVYATLSPDRDLPGSAVVLKKKLGIDRSIAIFEVRNQCSGFMYGLMTAEALIDGGGYKRVIVIGSEIQSSGLDLSTEGRATAVLFADGCGVALVVPDQEGPHKILGIELHSDGRHAEKLCVTEPGFASEGINPTDFETPRMFPFMEGKFIFHMASQAMPSAVKSIVSRCGYSLDELKLIVPHQANQRILDMLSREFAEKIRVFSNIAQYGNTTAASIPIALTEAREQELIQPGDLVCLCTFGAGVSWGAALIRW